MRGARYSSAEFQENSGKPGSVSVRARAIVPICTCSPSLQIMSDSAKRCQFIFDGDVIVKRQVVMKGYKVRQLKEVNDVIPLFDVH